MVDLGAAGVAIDVAANAKLRMEVESFILVLVLNQRDCHRPIETIRELRNL